MQNDNEREQMIPNVTLTLTKLSKMLSFLSLFLERDRFMMQRALKIATKQYSIIHKTLVLVAVIEKHFCWSWFC